MVEEKEEIQGLDLRAEIRERAVKEVEVEAKKEIGDRLHHQREDIQESKIIRVGIVEITMKREDQDLSQNPDQ